METTNCRKIHAQRPQKQFPREQQKEHYEKQLFVTYSRKALHSIEIKCITCRNCRSQTRTPVMGELSKEIFVDSTAFANVELDYFDPPTLKAWRRTQKRWYCLLICLKLQAVHIKIVPKLDTDSYLNQFMRGKI